jgi:hypothetical protein
MKKIIFLFFSLLALNASAQEFDLRLKTQNCSTFTVQIRCTDPAYLPTTADFIYGMDFNIISRDAFSLSVVSNFNGFNIGASGSITENSYNVRAFAEQTWGNIATNFSVNEWYDVCALVLTSGYSNIMLATSAETPTYASYFGTDTYQEWNELGRESTEGFLGKTWVGGSDDWNAASNWCPAAVPVSGESVIIPQTANNPVLSNDVTLGNVIIASNALLNLSGSHLNIGGALSGDGLITGSVSSKIGFTGSSVSTLRLDQSSNGTTNVLENLTINTSGEVIIADSVRITGVLTPVAGTITTENKLIIASAGVNTYGQIAPGAATFNGSVKIEKTLSNTGEEWRQIGLPVTASISDIKGVSIKLDGNDNEKNVYRWDATDAGAGIATGWVLADPSDNQNFAFNIFSSNTTGGIHAFSSLWWISGTPGSGDKTFALSNTEDPDGGANPNKGGWNLIPNPYPSNISVTALFGDNSAGAPFRDAGGIQYKAVHVWDAASGTPQYRAITASGVTNYNTNTTPLDITANDIAPFQAFWVKTDANTSFMLKDAYRSTSNAAGVFLKKDFDLARINVTDKDGQLDQLVLYFHENATAGFDPALDAYKLISLKNTVPSFYAVNADGIFTINALSAVEFSHAVPVGFRSSKKGQSSISLNNDALDAKWHVYLEDKELGIFADLKSGEYKFTHTVNSDSRFVIHFREQAMSADKVVNQLDKMTVGGDGESVYVFIPGHFREQAYQVEVFDLTGRKVYSTTSAALHQGRNTLNFHLAETGYYVVRVIASEEAVSSKVYVK